MPASEILVNACFYTFALLAVGGAVLVAVSRNIVRSAFALLAVLFAAAALYALMKADFIAAAQVLIYVGGILVLIMFAVMLTHRITDVNISNESTPGPAAFFACLCLLFSLAVVILFPARWEEGPQEVPVPAGDVRFRLLQYQADGRTGLAIGGAAFEDRVVLGVQVENPPEGAAEVEVELTPAGEKAIPVLSSPLDPHRTGLKTVEFKELGEKPYRWQARLKGGDGGYVTPAASFGPGTHFRVYRGITEPAAMALMGPYLFAFEVISVLLLAALVGAAFLARKEVKE